MKDKNFDNKSEMKRVKKKMRFWLFISGIFFVLSGFLILVAYQVAMDYQQGKAISISSLGLLPFKLGGEKEEKKENEASLNANLIRRVIDGVYVEEGDDNYFPVAVVIDNHVDARPPAGLAQANLVIEAEAEGGITRYLAVFADGEDIVAIGPVRSARPYFVDWAHELSAVLVHCGGSPAALVKIIRNNAINLNEFYQGDYFWRDRNRTAPHNIYISTENLNSFLEKKNLDQGKFFGWQFKDGADHKERPERGAIKINFILSDFIVTWQYKKDSNNYIRYLAGQTQADASGQIITAKNIIIQYAEAQEIDEELRLKMDIIGSGEAVICLDGICHDGQWRKGSASARTRFYNQVGEEIKFNAGPIWVEVVRPEYEVEFE